MDAIFTSGRPCANSRMVLLAAGLMLMAGSGCDWVSQSQNVTGVGLYEQGNYAAAIDQFQMAIQNDPGDADSYYNLGATYYRLGNLTHNSAQLQEAEVSPRRARHESGPCRLQSWTRGVAGARESADRSVCFDAELGGSQPGLARLCESS